MDSIFGTCRPQWAQRTMFPISFAGRFFGAGLSNQFFINRYTNQITSPMTIIRNSVMSFYISAKYIKGVATVSPVIRALAFGGLLFMESIAYL